MIIKRKHLLPHPAIVSSRIWQLANAFFYETKSSSFQPIGFSPLTPPWSNLWIFHAPFISPADGQQSFRNALLRSYGVLAYFSIVSRTDPEII